MDNRITYTNWGKTYDLDLVRATYINNGNLAVVAFVAGTHERYGSITVNLDELASPLACIDTNNMPGIFEILLSSGLAQDTCYTMESGYCKYPIASFDLAKLPDYEEYLNKTGCKEQNLRNIIVRKCYVEMKDTALAMAKRLIMDSIWKSANLEGKKGIIIYHEQKSCKKAKVDAVANFTVIEVGRLELNEAIKVLRIIIVLQNVLKED